MTTLLGNGQDRFTIWSNKSFVIFSFTRVATTLAYQILGVAIGWQIYALTSNPLDLGLVGLAQFVPTVLFTLMSGHIVDRYDRKIIFQLSVIIEGLGAFVLAVGSYYGWLNREIILFIIFFIGAARAFERPAMQALLPGLVPTKLFPQAIAWSTSSNQTATIVGPALGGLLYLIDPSVDYSGVGILFLISGILVSLIVSTQIPYNHKPMTLQSLFAGITFIRNQPVILGAISLDLFAVLLGGATALLPVYAREILMVGPQGLGVLRAAPAIGALVMSAFLGYRPLHRRAGKTMFTAVGLFGIATAIFAVSTSFTVSFFALIILGSADVFSVVIRQSLVQIQTPDEMRGRVSAVNLLFIGTSNQLGEFESGVTAAWFGVVPAVLIGGIGTLLIAAIWVRLFPELAQTDTLEPKRGI